MKITFCIDSISKGGAERVLVNLANHLAENETNKVDILTLRKSNSAYLISDKVKLLTLNININKKNLFQKVKNLFLNLKRYREYIETSNPDIIISFLPRSSYYSAIIASKTKTKLIISERNNPSSIYTSKIKKVLTNYLYGKADKLVFQTRMAKDFFSKKIQNKSIIIPNSVAEEFFDNSYIGTRQKKVVTVGRLAEQKNHSLLINAFKIVVENHPEYKLYIYGEGPLKEKLLTIIKNYRLENNVYLMGISCNIIEDIYDASIFVLSSNFEGMPNALMEALTLGVPSISTDCDCGGPKQLIQDGVNGLLVPVGDSQKLANAINELIENQKLSHKFSINSIKQMKNYKKEIIYSKWIDVIDNIVEGQKNS